MLIRWTSRRSLAALALLAVVACALCASTYRIFGNFWDEPEHIAAGLVLIDRGEYRYDVQHPPLARLAAAIGPYLAGAHFSGDPDPVGDNAGRDLLYHSSASYDTLLTLARLGMLPFLLLLLGATFAWTRHWYGDPAALLALVFLVSCPVILGHASLVALDVPVTALIMASLYLLLRWFEKPSLARGTALGVACGLAVATKMSAIPFIGVASVTLGLLRLAFLRRTRASTPDSTPLRLRWVLRQWALRVGSLAPGLLLGLILIIGVYGDRLVYLTTSDLAPSRALNFYFGTQGTLHDLAYRIAARLPLPFGFRMLPENIMGVEWHNTHGHPSYLLGQIAWNGWWYFYPVALAVKTTLPLLLLGLTGLAMQTVRGLREHNLYRMAPAACFAAILVFSCLYSHINIGVRHVLIAYPLLAMGAGVALESLWQRWSTPWARTGLAGLLLWQVATLAYAYPDYLAYFNALAGRHPERILVDSDLDWGGQDLRRLERLLAARQVSAVSIGYKGTADLSLEHLPPYQLLKPGQPVHGWVAITMLTLQENPAGYDWLRQYQPIQRVGQSFELYFIP